MDNKRTRSTVAGVSFDFATEEASSQQEDKGR